MATSATTNEEGLLSERDKELIFNEIKQLEIK
jgi:hypothetical protein